MNQLKVKKEANRRALQKSILEFSVAENLGSTVTKEQASVIEDAKLSLLSWVDIYYQYSLQEILRQVSSTSS